MKQETSSNNLRPIARAEFALAALLAVIAIAYPVFRGLIDPKPEVDFRFYWFAGYMWAHGLDPYSPAFFKLGNHLLPPGSELRYWFYPPQWWPISRVLALFDFPTALQVWRGSLAVILIASTGSVVAFLTRGQPVSRRAFLVAGACALAATMESTADVISGGQVSPVLVYAGFALIICSFITSRTPLLVAGLVLVSLKPQIGAFVFLAFLMSRAHWRAVAYAVAVILALSLPQLLSFGPLSTAQEFINNYRGFNSIAGNIPLAMTGPTHLLARAGLELPLTLSFPFAVAGAIAGGLMLQRDPYSMPALALIMAGLAAFVPLHNYDMTIILLVATLILKTGHSRVSRAIVAVALALAVRPSRIEALFSVTVYGEASGGVILYSAISLALLGLAVRRALGGPNVDHCDESFFSPAVMGRSTNR